ncbi:MAG: hypothetical protein ABI683_03920 [Ginsengibacter sp.]
MSKSKALRTNKIIVGVIVLILVIAFFTKPDDKTIKIKTINALWGDMVPDVNDKPDFYESFMNTTTVAITIDDWLLLKRIKYKTKDGDPTVGFAAFGQVMIRK